MNRLILICCLMISGFGVLAQQADVSEVVIDTLTKKGNKSAPFDRSFVLKVPFDKKPELNFLSVARINRNGEEQRVSKRELKKFYHWLKYNGNMPFEYEAYMTRISKSNYNDFLKKYDFENILNNDELESLKKARKSKNKNSLKRLLYVLDSLGRIDKNQRAILKAAGKKNQMPTYLKVPLESIQYKKQGTKQLATFEMFPIEPDKTYRMKWARMANDKEIETFYGLIAARCKTKIDSDTLKNLKIEANKLSIIEPSIGSISDKFGKHCDTYNKLPTYIEIDELVTKSINSFIKCVGKHEALQVLLNHSLPCKDCGNCENCGKAVETYKKSLGGFTTVINNLFHIGDTTANNYLLGYLPLNHKTGAKRANENKIFDRIRNFNSTKKSINGLIDELKTLNTNLRSNVISGLIDCLENMQTDIFEQLTTKYKAYVTFKSKIKKDVNTFEFEDGNDIVSDISDFDTRSKLQIVPTFGLITYGFQHNGGNNPNFWGATPYLGFQVNLRPIDKNIPLKNIPYKSIWHRLSIQAGWTLISLKEDGVREDLFKNKSFMTGLGFKLSNAVSLNSGVLFFKEVDPNPLINETSTAISPYLGLSIDLDIAEYLNDFTSIFK